MIMFFFHNRPVPGARENRESGLTLIELLVALVLLALVSVMLSGGLRFSARAWEYSDSRLEKIERIQAVQHLLRSRLGSAQFSKNQTATERRSPPGPPGMEAFVGDFDHVEFIAKLPRHHGLGGLYRIAIDGVAGTRNTNNLRIRWRPAETGFTDIKDGQTEDWTETTLLEDIEGLKIEYFGKQDKAENEGWSDVWSDPRKLPSLVRLSVAFSSHDPRRWPVLTVKVISATP